MEYRNRNGNFNESFEMFLRAIVKLLKADEYGMGFLDENGEPRDPKHRPPFGARILDFPYPAAPPPLQPAEFARQIGIVLSDEFVADIAVKGSKIRVMLPDRTFVLSVSKAHMAGYGS
jgi:hypothetical protein